MSEERGSDDPAQESAFSSDDAGAGEELTNVARAARAEGRPSPAAGKQPRSLMTLAIIIFCVLGMGVYALVYARRLVEKNAHVRWHTLEQRLVDYQAQELFKKQHGYEPAGMDVNDLSPADKADLENLRSRYGKLMLQPLPRSDGGKLVLIKRDDGTIISTQPAPTTAP